jgi:hypothetical protein
MIRKRRFANPRQRAVDAVGENADAMRTLTSEDAMTATTDSVVLAGCPLGDCRHVCAFFVTPDDEYRTLLPFVREGLDRGERSVAVVPGSRDDHIGRLRASGIDVESILARQQLQVLRSEDTYTRDGHFDQDVMLARLPGLLNAGRELGYTRTRLVAHAEFVLADEAGAHAFAEYEARLNDVLPYYPDIVICTYDLGQVGAASVVDALRTHPMIIIAGVLRQNSFYVQPDVFIEEVHARERRDVSGAGGAGGAGASRTHYVRS